MIALPLLRTFPSYKAILLFLNITSSCVNHTAQQASHLNRYTYLKYGIAGVFLRPFNLADLCQKDVLLF